MSIALPVRALAVLAGAVMLSAACTASGASGPFDSPGGRLYLQNCAGCHGARAQGGVGPPLDATGHAHHHSDTELIQAITEGIARPGAATVMPPWGGRLSPQQVRQLVEFMKTLWTPEQRAQQQALNAQ